MKQFLLIFATMLFMGVSLNAQAPDVHVSPDKYVKDIGKQLKVLQNRKGKYGYVDENGVQIILPSFDKAEPFEDGYAIVANEVILENGEVDVEWGIIRHPEL